MSLVIETFLICDVCGKQFGVDNKGRHGYQQRFNAMKEGWLISTGKDICSVCRQNGIIHQKKQML